MAEARIAPCALGHVGEQVGWGLFAAARIPRGGWIGEYTGVIRRAIHATRENMQDGRFLSDYAFAYPRPLPDGTRLEVDALRAGNMLRFVNHARRPNATVNYTLFDNRWVTFFQARREIARGQELTIDYGRDYWSGGLRTLVE
jgi:SET domain-containing protein